MAKCGDCEHENDCELARKLKEFDGESGLDRERIAACFEAALAAIRASKVVESPTFKFLRGEGVVILSNARTNVPKEEFLQALVEAWNIFQPEGLIWYGYANALPVSEGRSMEVAMVHGYLPSANWERHAILPIIREGGEMRFGKEIYLKEVTDYTALRIMSGWSPDQERCPSGATLH